SARRLRPEAAAVVTMHDPHPPTRGPEGTPLATQERGSAPVVPLLTVDNLTTVIHGRRRTLSAVDHVSFTVGNGEMLGLVGESGCGKSMPALSIMRLLPPTAAVAEGTVRFGERDLLRLSGGEMRKVRGNEIAMVFQEPMTALDPAFTIGSQIT